MALRELDCGFCTKRWCAILKENALFAFIWTGSAALIAPDRALVGFRPSTGGTVSRRLVALGCIPGRMKYCREVTRNRQLTGEMSGSTCSRLAALSMSKRARWLSSTD